MSRIVTVDLPFNISEIDAPLFAPFAQYELNDLNTIFLHEVFVTNTGLCIDETGVRKESHHAYADKQEIFLNDAVVQFRQALDNPGQLIELDDDETYLLIHHPWSANYWHWMTECILRVWQVRERLDELILLLPQDMPAFAKRSLEGFRFKGICIIPRNKHLLVRNLCVPEVKRFADSYYSTELNQIRAYYLERNHVKGKIITGDKLYISRKKSQKRRVVNEDEVEQMLGKYGFDCVCNEDYDFNEQVSLYSKARYVISIHGAGLTNMLFMKEGASVLELHKRRTNDHDWHSFAFWYMSNALGFNYYQQVCEPDNPASTFFDANFLVDVSLLEKNVQRML